MINKKLYSQLIIILVLFFAVPVLAQPTWTLNPFGKEKKPEKYEEKILPSEKTADKKMTGFRRFIHNNTTKFNYYFNANNKLNAVVENAKLAYPEDYGTLLNFYPYTLETTAMQSGELDSVIYKSTAGILLHDLRTDWVDNMYLLIGKSYFYRNELDSAAITFQFINYNLFPRKKKNDDDDRIVGTNDNTTNGFLSIANKENMGLLAKVLKLPPSRNDALIWLAKTYVEQKKIGESAGLINILQKDPNLPKRLKNDLEEVTAYWFYTQSIYDSTITHLEKGLSNAESGQDKSRWMYLIAQLYEITKQHDKASQYYKMAGRRTTDPILEIHAALSDAKMLRGNGDIKELENTVANLIRMAKKDKYDGYQDIIYYSAADLSLQKPDTANASSLFNKAVTYNFGRPAYRTKSFLKLEEISFKQKNYKAAYNYYDSLDFNSPIMLKDSAFHLHRMALLSRLVDKIKIVEKEDSLQKIAAMPEAERESFVKKLSKKLRKELGLLEDNELDNNRTVISFNSKTVDLFSSKTAANNIFDNSKKSKGYSDFIAKWGKRQNIDGWRRSYRTVGPSLPPGVTENLDGDINVENIESLENQYSYQNMIANLPLTKEKLDKSNKLIAESMLEMAKIFQLELQDYPQAIATYEAYIARFGNIPEASLGLSFCYSRTGDNSKSQMYKNVLTTKFADSKEAKIAQNPESVMPNLKNEVATKRYEDIYNMYIEGNFDSAATSKKNADSLHGANYWSPQLLYIESISLIKQQKDSLAQISLKKLQNLYPQSPLADKAKTMSDVLKRRPIIEKYLDSLKVSRQEDVMPTAPQEQVQKYDSTKNAIIKVDSVSKTTPIVKAENPPIKSNVEIKDKNFSINPSEKHLALMILNNVDPVYVTESKNALDRYNRELHSSKNLSTRKAVLDAANSIVVISEFANANDAINYCDKIKKAAAVEISWLPASKFSFIIITNENLSILQNNKDIKGYKNILNSVFNNKF